MPNGLQRDAEDAEDAVQDELDALEAELEGDPGDTPLHRITDLMGAESEMGRKQAQRELDLEAEQKRLDDQGILHSIRGKRDLDEAASAYKDIATVMANQRDLVAIVTELKPLAVVKG